MVVYLQGNSEKINLDKVLFSLKSQLPGFMCPKQYYILSEFPLTRNGKIDYKALGQLPNAEAASIEINDCKMDGATELVKQAWSIVLKRKEIPVEVNFFDAGGNSIFLARLLFHLKERFDHSIGFLHLMRYPTVKKFSDYIDSLAV